MLFRGSLCKLYIYCSPTVLSNVFLINNVYLYLFCLKRALEEKKLAREEAKKAEKFAMQACQEKTGIVEVYSKVTIWIMLIWYTSIISIYINILDWYTSCLFMVFLILAPTQIFKCVFRNE